MKYVVEILNLNGATGPKVLHSFGHTASTLHLVRESVHSVMRSTAWPAEANGFRIISTDGVQLYAWPIDS